MKIAVVGAGFCGMAITWNLIQTAGVEITLFDSKPIAKGTSGIAAGLLHPYVGAHSKLNWRGAEGMAATKKLIHIAEKTLLKQIAFPHGMLRLAMTDQQLTDFSTCTSHSDVHWRTRGECQARLPQIIPYPGIFIDSAITVDCESYLQGLWQACASRGAIFEQTPISTLKELANFDRVIIAMGADACSLPELRDLPIRPTKGQILEFSWPQEMTPLPYPVNSQAYLLMNPIRSSCIVGATYEKQFASPAPDSNVAKQEILPKAAAFFPTINQLELISCRAGVRAGTPDRKPLIEKIDDKCWVLTGMGSKGLLYHALFAEELVKKLFDFL